MSRITKLVDALGRAGAATPTSSTAAAAGPTGGSAPAGRFDEATRLVRAGRLTEATAAVQRALDASGGPVSGLPGASGLSGLAGMAGSGGGASNGRPTRGPGSVTRGSVSAAGGSLAYRLYVPTNPQTPSPVMVMLHGGTQDADVFAASTGMDEVAEREGIVVVYPEQSRSANPMGYWNWFRPGDQERDAGEPALIAAVVRAVAAGRDVDPARVGVAGFSAGAAMAAVMAATHPDVFCGAAVHSGMPHRAARDVGSAFATMSSPPRSVADAGPVPLLVVHGDADRTVAPGNADAVVRSAVQRTPGAEHERSTGAVDGGRTWTRDRWSEPGGRLLAESWTVHGLGHAWSGGRAGQQYADPSGPDASSIITGVLGLNRR